MLKLIGQLIRPYRGTLLIILCAMIVETAMSLAAPWPLKIIIDNVAGSHKLPEWLHRMLGPVVDNGNPMHVALLGNGSGLHRRPRCDRELCGQLFHRECRAICSARPPFADVSSSATPVARLLQYPPARHSTEYDHH